MQSIPPCQAPACWWLKQVSSLLLHWQSQLSTYSVIFCFSLSYVALWDSKTPHRLTFGSISYCVETSPLSWFPPQDGYTSLNLLSLFLSFIFCPTSFEENGLPSGYLVSSASVQKLFCGNCSIFKWSFDEFGGVKTGLPTLFLCHLKTAYSPNSSVFASLIACLFFLHFWRISSQGLEFYIDSFFSFFNILNILPHSFLVGMVLEKLHIILYFF